MASGVLNAFAVRCPNRAESIREAHKYEDTDNGKNDGVSDMQSCRTTMGCGRGMPLKREKELTRLRDRMSAERRALRG